MSDPIKIVTSNRKARYEYFIEESLEAGIALTGSEVKSLREGRANLQDAFCKVERGEMMLYNCHISLYSHGSEYFGQEPVRPRKLLLHRREIKKWRKASEQKGYTIIPLKIYFVNGRAKMEIGLAKGKKTYDKREAIAEQETKRRLQRLVR